MREEQEPKIEEASCKVILLGEQGVGKSTLVKKWFNNIFPQNYKSTIGADFALNTFEVGKQRIQLRLTDVGGAEKSGDFMRAYLKGVNAVFLMWDSSRDQTYRFLIEWLKLILLHLPPETPVIFIRGKSDLMQKGKDASQGPSDVEIYKLAGDFGLTFFRVITISAKDDADFTILENAISEIVKIHERKENQLLNDKEGKVSYKPDPFTHTRKVRFVKLWKMMMDPSCGKPLPKRYMWMLMHVISIDDFKSQTSLWLQKNLAKEIFSRDGVEETPNQQSYGDSVDIFQKMVLRDRKRFATPLAYYSSECSRLALGILKDAFSAGIYEAAMKENSKALDAVIALLALLSEKETQIIGFKICFFDAEIKREQQYKEMGLIYEVADRIFEFIFDNEIFLPVGHNNNNAEPVSKVLAREDLLQGLADRYPVDIPSKVTKIINKLLGKPSQEPSPSGPLAQPKLF